MKSYLTPSITIPPFLIASATLLTDIFSFYKASFLVLNSSLSFEDSKTNFLNFLPLEGNPKAFLSSYTKRRVQLYSIKMVQCFIVNIYGCCLFVIAARSLQKYVLGNSVSQNVNFTYLINMLVGKRRFPKCKFR